MVFSWPCDKSVDDFQTKWTMPENGPPYLTVLLHKSSVVDCVIRWFCFSTPSLSHQKAGLSGTKISKRIAFDSSLHKIAFEMFPQAVKNCLAPFLQNAMMNNYIFLLVLSAHSRDNFCPNQSRQKLFRVWESFSLLKCRNNHSDYPSTIIKFPFSQALQAANVTDAGANINNMFGLAARFHEDQPRAIFLSFLSRTVLKCFLLKKADSWTHLGSTQGVTVPESGSLRERQFERLNNPVISFHRTA